MESYYECRQTSAFVEKKEQCTAVYSGNTKGSGLTLAEKLLDKIKNLF